MTVPDYSNKQESYYDGLRMSFVQEMPDNPSARLLDVGCGTGRTAEMARAMGKCGWCCGIELCVVAADKAATRLDRVVIGNVESLECDLPEGSFDVMILSEVLEHLVDPMATLVRLRRLLRRGAFVLVGTPNVCHHSVIRMLVGGRWECERKGIMDNTHLRWFTAKSLRTLVEASGYAVERVGPAFPLGVKARFANLVTLGLLHHLFYGQICLRACRY